MSLVDEVAPGVVAVAIAEEATVVVDRRAAVIADLAVAAIVVHAVPANCSFTIRSLRFLLRLAGVASVSCVCPGLVRSPSQIRS